MLNKNVADCHDSYIVITIFIFLLECTTIIYIFAYEYTNLNFVVLYPLRSDTPVAQLVIVTAKWRIIRVWEREK
jgi:Na+/alanine symporter